MILTAIPLTISATEPDTVCISISDDEYFLTDIDGNTMANYPVTLDELAVIDLADYGLEEYGFSELTALHLYIYVHEYILGLDWSEVYVTVLAKM